MKSYVIFTDGSCEPVNPNGNIGVGMVVYEAENFSFKRSSKDERQVKSSYSSIKKIHEESAFYNFGTKGFEQTSNNMAEHMAMNLGLMWIDKNNHDNRDVFFFTDSLMTAGQMSGNFKVNMRKVYGPIADKNKLKLINLFLKIKKIEFHWIPRELNKVADALSNKKHTSKGYYSK